MAPSRNDGEPVEGGDEDEEPTLSLLSIAYRVDGSESQVTQRV